MSQDPQHLRRTDHPIASALIVVSACIAVYWVGLGHAGFGATEGHRAIPAWEMLDSGEWWLPQLFERAYLRKPPGMAWAVAASSAVLGRTEFAARAVSAVAATASALLALVFARRWFGPRAGLPAGLAQALMPVWLTFARSAEIESLHTLSCQCAALLTIDLTMRGRSDTMMRTMALAASMIAAGLIKGPAGIPILVAALVASGIASHAWRAVVRPSIGVALAITGAVLIGVYLMVRARLAASGLVPVLQDPSEFVPSLARLPRILRLVPAALVQGLPVIGVVALALWPRVETRDHERAAALGVPEDAGTLARTLGLTFALSLLALMIGGVSNPRYALPALVPLAPLAGWCWTGRLGLFDGRRRTLAVWASLSRLWVWPVIAVVLTVVYIFVFMEPRRVEISGKRAGERLAESLPDGAVLYADWLVEARPEVLHYARARAAELGKVVRVRWVDLERITPDLNEKVFVALRDDHGGNERIRPGVSRLIAGWRLVHTDEVYKYRFEVLERTTPSQK